MRARIVHISTDYPDAVVPEKTKAISNLVALTEDQFDHCVYSLNRVSPRIPRLVLGMAGSLLRPMLPIELASYSDGLRALRYQAPPKGLYLRSLLERVADWIASDIERSGSRPALIHGHKLTMEGLVAARVAAQLGIPYALSLQGNTDRSILSVRPDLAADFRRVFHGAAVVFPFSPWILAFVEARLGHRSGPTIVLPCATSADRVIAPQRAGPMLISAFHLAHHKLKNCASLIAASKRLVADIPGYRLELIGGGSDADRAAIERMIESAGASSVRLAGPVAHDKIQQRMNRAAGFALVSRKESFGMVFIEALLAGCPIVYPAGMAVEGYFDDCEFAISASPDDLDGIEDGMRRLVRDEQRLKSSLARWQSGSEPRRFQREAIAAAYSEGIRRALSPSHPVTPPEHSLELHS